jgi:MoxR-like ATPase
MKIRIHSPLSTFAYDLAADLEAKGFAPVTVALGPTDRYEIEYKSSVPATDVSRLLEALDPLQPEKIGIADLQDPFDLELWLGAEMPEDGCEAVLVTDSTGWARELRALTSRLGLGGTNEEVRLVDEDVVLYNESPAYFRQVVRWVLGRKGIRVGERQEDDWDGNLCVQVRDPHLASKRYIDRYTVTVCSDDEAAVAGLVDTLTRQGFHCNPVVPLTAAEIAKEPICLKTGPFTRERAASEFARLHVALDDLVAAQKVDTRRYPVQVVNDAAGVMDARLILPLAACRSGTKRPYSGPYPERFQISLITDSPPAVESLRGRMQAAGFDRVVLRAPEELGEGAFVHGFVIVWAAAAREAKIAKAIKDAVREELAATGLDRTFSLRVTEQAGDDPEVKVFFPHAGVLDGSLLTRLTNPSAYNVKLHAPDPAEWDDLYKELEKWGFANCAKETRDSGPREISHGGAPPELVMKLRNWLREKTGLDFPGHKQWPDTDMDVWFYLPRRKPKAPDKPKEEKKPAAPPPEQGPSEIEVWAFPVEAAGTAPRPFVELTADYLRLGSVMLPRRVGQRDPLAPDPADFNHFCLDGMTCATLEHIATSVLLREPCLLEGETSTSKTSSILFLASLLGQPVARLNLNGQTDTGELVGRFVPQNLQNELPLSRIELQQEMEWLEPETRMILERARQANRALTRVEVQQIMANERMASLPWRWQDGLVVQAMRHGWWVILDEVNLGEPQILERLNSVLESNPMLVLTENDNSVLGPGGTPIHPDFRIFATMNPAEYSGRSVLSPAYRDRWRGYWFTPRAGEREYLDMLRLLVHGRQPDTQVRGRAYAGTPADARYAVLGAMPEIDKLLEALARFHVALEHAAGQAGTGAARIGSRRKERYVFTRRGILGLLEFLASPLCQADGGMTATTVRQGLVRYYVGRVAVAEDRTMVVQLLDAAGIGPHTWNVGQ